MRGDDGTENNEEQSPVQYELSLIRDYGYECVHVCTREDPEGRAKVSAVVRC